MRFRAPPARLWCWHPSAKVRDRGLEFRELVLLACAPLSRLVLAVWMPVLPVGCALQDQSVSVGFGARRGASLVPGCAQNLWAWPWALLPRAWLRPLIPSLQGRAGLGELPLSLLFSWLSSGQATFFRQQGERQGPGGSNVNAVHA